MSRTEIQQALDREKAIMTEVERLRDKKGRTSLDDTRLVALHAEFRGVHRKRLDAQHDAALAEIRSAADGAGPACVIDAGPESRSGGGGYDADPLADPRSAQSPRRRYRDPWNLNEVRTFGREEHELAGEFRSRALSAIEMMPGADDRVRSAATDIIERFDDSRGALARHALIASSPTYLRAWSKMARSEAHLLAPEESRALSEVRAMAIGTGATGGYLVPFQLDPSVIITSAGSRNDIRQYARQVIATGDVWHGVSAGAVEWSWDGEATEVSDDSPTLAQPEIRLHKAQGFVPISIEAMEDAANATQEVGRLLAFGKASLEAVALITGAGDGSNQPTGLITALDGTSAVVTPTTAETLAVADLFKLQGALPARHRANASWLANNLVYNVIRQFDTSGGASLWEYLGGDRPARLLGRPAGEAEAMTGTWNSAVTATNHVMVFGDFSNFVIADRLGMTVEFIPHLVGANRRPTGQRGWYAYTRVGSGVVDTGAFKVLNIATTA